MTCAFCGRRSEDCPGGIWRGGRNGAEGLCCYCARSALRALDPRRTIDVIHQAASGGSGSRATRSRGSSRSGSTLPTVLRGLIDPLPCDCCGVPSTYRRGSMWHGSSRICAPCFWIWYDHAAPTDPASIKAERLERYGTRDISP